MAWAGTVIIARSLFELGFRISQWIGPVLPRTGKPSTKLSRTIETDYRTAQHWIEATFEILEDPSIFSTGKRQTGAQSMHLRLSSGEFVLVDGAFPLRGPALVATVNQSLNSKLSNAEDPTLRDELKGKAALVFSPWCWQPFIASSKEIVRLENLLWPIEIAKGSGTPELLLDQMGFGLPPQWNLDAETIYRGTCDLSTLHQHLGWRSKKLMEMVLAHPSVDQRRRRQSEHFTLLLCLQPFVSFGEFLKNQPRRSM